MYTDKAKKHTGVWLLVLALVVLLVLVFLIFGHSGKDISEESTQAIQEAVRRSALQCYVVEGVYPSTLEYLEENYGLQVNREDFYITYDAFASNLPPEVHVIRK